MKNMRNNIILILLSLLLTTFFAGCFLTPPTNHAPNITSTEVTTATVGEVYSYDVEATDPDGDTLIYTLTAKPPDMTIDSVTGVINWTPDTIGDYDITVNVEDGILNDIQSFSIKVSKSSPTSPPVTPPDNPEEIEYKVVVSAQIDLEVGGVVEVTDENSEIYETRFVVDKNKFNKNNIRNIATRSKYAWVSIILILAFNHQFDDYQGFLMTPIVVQADSDDEITGTLEIKYNEDKLSNAGVKKDAMANVYRIKIPTSGEIWEKVPESEYIDDNNTIKISIGSGDLEYYYTLTVTNCKPPDNLGTPLPGDLLYRLSNSGEIDNWLPGHVGIYVGEKYHETDGRYNVIEELGSPWGMVGLGPNKVIRAYYEDITKFGGDQYVYMGAREPEIQKLNHNERNALIAFLENEVGKKYAFYNTLFGLYKGKAKGDNVKGKDDKYNCVGLTEAAYEYLNINIVNDEDEGNLPGTEPPDAILTPQEQRRRTVFASGIIKNIPPVISKLISLPLEPIETTKTFTLHCYATDEDNDNLTYIWTIPGLEPFIKGKDIGFLSPDISTEFIIYCKVKDNYGGEYEKSVKVSISPETYVITASAGSNGTIDPSGEITVNKGDDQSFTITPNTGYQIDDVLVDGSSIGVENSYNFNNVTEDHTISASFIEEVINHAPVINSTPITTATQDETYNYDVNAVDSDGDDLTYSLTTKPSGMIINSSTGLITWTPSSTGDYDVTVKASDGDLFDTQEYAITVSSVVPDTFTITASAGSNGSINPSGDVTVNEGSDQLFNITPDSGYQIDDVLVDGSSIGVESSYTFTNVTQDHTISATFVVNTSEVVEFEDPNLEQVIREKINKPEGPLYLNDVIGITELNANGKGIISLEGIQHLQNLRNLIIGNNINGNHISDISPLSNLTNLNSLEFQYNQVTDISPLSNLTNLEKVVLYSNQVSDISVLSNLINLKELNIGENQVSDISVLSNLINLQKLDFSKNQVSDISSLSNLTNLKELSISENQVLNISPLSNLINLQHLTFFSNQVSDISPLSNLTTLEDLWFGINPVSDISSLSNLTNLKELVFSSSQVSDISPLSNLTTLEYLWFSRNQVSDISPLVNNEGFDTGDYIRMENNYLDLSEGSQNMQDIETLISRGVIVDYEPQTNP